MRATTIPARRPERKRRYAPRRALEPSVEQAAPAGSPARRTNPPGLPQTRRAFPCYRYEVRPRSWPTCARTGAVAKLCGTGPASARIEDVSLRLLCEMAAVPPAEVEGRVAADVAAVRAALETVLREDACALRYEDMLRWRNALDEGVRDLEAGQPIVWAADRRPGTWLDSVLRLRGLLAHYVGRAYWDGVEEVRVSDIDVERYLWGAR